MTVVHWKWSAISTPKFEFQRIWLCRSTVALTLCRLPLISVIVVQVLDVDVLLENLPLYWKNNRLFLSDGIFMRVVHGNSLCPVTILLFFPFEAAGTFHISWSFFRVSCPCNWTRNVDPIMLFLTAVRTCLLSSFVLAVSLFLWQFSFLAEAFMHGFCYSCWHQGLKVSRLTEHSFNFGLLCHDSYPKVQFVTAVVAIQLVGAVSSSTLWRMSRGTAMLRIS